MAPAWGRQTWVVVIYFSSMDNRQFTECAARIDLPTVVVSVYFIIRL